MRGQFDVGYRSLVSNAEGTRPLDVHIWYPALNPTGAKEEVVYTEDGLAYQSLVSDGEAVYVLSEIYS